MGLRACEIFHERFKNSLCFPQPFSFPPHKPRWTSKPEILGAHHPGAGSIPSCNLPLQEALQNQQVGLNQALFKLLLLYLDLECLRFCIHPFKSEVSVSYRPLALPKISPTDFQSQTFWELIFPVQGPWSAEPNVGLRLLDRSYSLF